VDLSATLGEQDLIHHAHLQPILELRDLDLIRPDLGLELLIQRLVGLVLGAQGTDLLDLLLVG
jgi:hypothetical protein